MSLRSTFAALVICFTSSFCAADLPTTSEADRIRPLPENAYFWQYKGKPIRLVGGSKDDNLFQIPDLEKHLNDIKAAGGNYVRNTMSDRPDQGWEVYPFAKLPNGKFDLSHWNDEYWNRFEAFLRETAKRDIIVQIEVWDRFDYTDVRQPNWQSQPYNPKNNVNYSFDESGFAERYPDHPGQNKQPFFFTPPTLSKNDVVLQFQKAQVDKMLSYALAYPNVLYCIDNETSGKEEWATFWAEHIRQRAKEASVEVCITEMWDDWNVKGGRHSLTYEHPERYDFVDISQNNHNVGQEHWDNLMWVRGHLAKQPRPINHVKIYGANTGRYGTTRDGLERFWRNVIGGAASARFHRPESGLGLDETARKHLQAFRLLEAECELFRCNPDSGSTLLAERTANEAYLTYEIDRQYVVYFPAGGEVTLDLMEAEGLFDVRWLDVERNAWKSGDEVAGGEWARLRSPIAGHAVCVVHRR